MFAGSRGAALAGVKKNKENKKVKNPYDSVLTQKTTAKKPSGPSMGSKFMSFMKQKITKLTTKAEKEEVPTEKEQVDQMIEEKM